MTKERHRLTDRQLAVYVYMQEFFKENDQLPTTRAIADKFGFVSLNSASYIQLRLASCGWIERNACGKYRFARIDQGVQA
jgi:SOS-response transcriptional repressor LexA